MYKLNDQSDVELHEDGASAFKAAEEKKAADEAKVNSLPDEELEAAKKSRLDSQPAKKDPREDKKAAQFDSLSKGKL